MSDVFRQWSSHIIPECSPDVIAKIKKSGLWGVPPLIGMRINPKWFKHIDKYMFGVKPSKK